MTNAHGRLFFFCLSLIFCGSALADPAMPKDVLYKPTFLVLDDSWTAGTAFLVRLDGQSGLFLITANHLFGPDAGLKNQMTPDEIAHDVKGVAALSMQDVSKAFWFPTFIKIADAISVESKSCAKDLAVFKAADSPGLQTLELASDMPKKGDRVWVFARQRGDDTPALLAATVEDANDSALTYIFDRADFRLPGTSGAPVLNEQGKVVGMNLAAGDTADKKCKGWANPVSSIRSELAAALRGK
jgi:hypothetical protein